MSDRWIAHLYRRAGFGPPPGDAPATFDTALEHLLAGLDDPVPADPPGFDPYDPKGIERQWLSHMLSGRAPLAEKLALFWHGHFATSIAKVDDGGSMWRQYRLFRASGPRRFQELLHDVSCDPAMLRWLDGINNVSGHPNENYARELMERFTLGVGHYTEHDVREAARALSGWSLRIGNAVFVPEQHDAKPAQLLGHTVQSMEDVVATLSHHPQCARWLSRQLLRFFVLDPAPPEAVERLAQVWQEVDGRISRVLAALFRDPLFRSDRCYEAQIKSPVEYLVGALREKHETAVPHWAPTELRRMGQALFAPPSVKGWPGGMGWLDTTTMVERFQTAALLGMPQLATPQGQVN
ncbi:MAG: DUF1800 domain-containing protein [Candidatus Xenobia bacterium]